MAYPWSLLTWRNPSRSTQRSASAGEGAAASSASRWSSARRLGSPVRGSCRLSSWARSSACAYRLETTKEPAATAAAPSISGIAVAPGWMPTAAADASSVGSWTRTSGGRARQIPAEHGEPDRDERRACSAVQADEAERDDSGGDGLGEALRPGGRPPAEERGDGDDGEPREREHRPRQTHPSPGRSTRRRTRPSRAGRPRARATPLRLLSRLSPA